MPPTHHSFHVGVVVSFGRLLPESLTAAFPYGIVNVHPSLLPRWRGPAPITHTVLSGDKETGICIMHIRPHKYDVGPILLRQRVPVHHRCTTRELATSLAHLGADLLVRALRDLPENVQCSIPQDKEGGTHAPKPSMTLAWVRWSQHTCEQVDRLHRALHERMPLRTLWKGQTLKILDLEPPVNIPLGQDVNHSAPGSLYYDKATRILYVRCKDGWVGVRSLLFKKRLSAEDFYNGYLHVHFQRGRSLCASASSTKSSEMPCFVSPSDDVIAQLVKAKRGTRPG
uniref:methionyl-tRNA formyltransferase n=1 Tax=Eptatretus burgeri TaxID=7764 RepID=A0A8C4Q438_EPTBU